MQLRKVDRCCSLLVQVSLVAFVLGGSVQPASGSGILEWISNAIGGFKVVDKNGTSFVAEDTDADASAATIFDFHPVDVQSTPLTKNLKTKVVTPSPLTHTYIEDEEHGTTGSATHNLGISDVTVIPQGSTTPVVIGTVLTGTVTAKINPGKNEEELPVEVQARLRDPLISSDVFVDANFGLMPDGLDVGFTLHAGTAFPEVFTLDPNAPGADPTQTFQTYRARVLPGVEADPDAFWDDLAPGALDLFELVLTSDVNHVVDAQLTVGSSNSDFVIDTSGVAGAESAIESAFAGQNGVLPADLSDLFTVGFDPTNAVSEFTFGIQQLNNLVANEVPEPASIGLWTVGLFAAGYLWRKRRPRQERRR